MYCRVFVLLGVASTLSLGGCGSNETTISASKLEEVRTAHNADKVIARCSADMTKPGGGNWVRPDAETPAAIVWVEGWPNSDGEVKGKKYAQIMSPAGRALPRTDEVRPQTFEARACWAIEEFASDAKRPIALPGATEEFTVICKDNAAMRSKLRLYGLAEVRFNPKKRQLTFFGAELDIVPSEGRTYLAVNDAFALSLDKDPLDLELDFVVTLASGEKLYGVCKAPTEN